MDSKGRPSLCHLGSRTRGFLGLANLTTNRQWAFESGPIALIKAIGNREWTWGSGMTLQHTEVENLWVGGKY